MAYIRNVWVPEELITAAKLNRMEDGIEDAYLRAERSIMDIIQNTPELDNILKNLITSYSMTIDQQNNKLIFNINSNYNI